MPAPPAPWLRRVYAAPRVLYRAGIGWLLGHWFLQLTHTGRRSGRRYRVILEVVRYDPATGEAVVLAGYGEAADWLRNVRAGGPVWVDFGRGERPAVVRAVPLDEAAEVLAAYERRYPAPLRPVLRRTIGVFAGFRYNGSDDDRARAADALPMVALRPGGALSAPGAQPGTP